MKTKNLLLTATAIFAATLSTIAQTIPAYVSTNGLLAWYPFNGNANDESGNGNNGIVYGATLTTDRNGSLNSAFNFVSAFSNHISLNSTIGNFGTSDFTVSGWQMRVSSTNINCMFGKRNATGSGNYFEVNSNPGFEIRQGTNTTDYVNDGNLNVVNNSSWFHTVIVRIGNQILLYINGNLSYTYNSPITQNISNSALTEIGARYNGSSLSQLYEGKIDDIGIWNRALTQLEITKLFNSTTSVSETFEKESINVYPNPASTKLHIDYINFGLMNGYTVKITNALGKNVYTSSINQPQLDIDLLNLSGSGIYFITTVDEANNIVDVRKVLIQ